MGFEEFDVFVIGTGTAGKSVAKECVAEGLKVAIADNREYGGTCANRGCDPKKVLVGLTEILDRAGKMKGHGITRMPEFSWKELMEFKKTFTSAVPAATEKDLESLGIKMYHQSPKFLDENTLSVEGKTVNAKKIVIATGHQPFELPIPGRELPVTSDEFLELEELPESIIFIGAGYIGMEFAHIAARCGVDVTVIDGESRALNNFDKDMVKYLQDASEEIGIKFIFDAEVTEVEKLQTNFRVKANQKGEKIERKAKLVVNAAGRVPAVDELDLEKGNVEYSKKGIVVNAHLQSPSNNNVYACGDVSASEGLPLTPLSSQEARIVAANILDKNREKEIDYPPQPSVVFTIPNLAMVGLNEKEAREKGYNFKVEQKLVSKWFNAKRINDDYYAYKTLVDKDSGLVLGAHLIGADAGEMINMFVMAMCGKLDCRTLKGMIFSYPSWASDIKSMV
ncbi:dihydrolipoyl dehydrogenase family protein [Christiangramia sabulilitoris]|uniref:NAD(P)/FAD-dependent oxidoreductase n=1 Tax=Christiangramia sabulilitoris TaxID=2583991 RepID=A0A550I8E7_9FLAO|nr:NAD(P)/FAD-dependent oxidoreductase [Christiangramia sabulilitoris]TRO67247.1 NAD(P)/FAD-dependent oxidoreductase [Christiangramia sabulilitoris]